MHQESLMVMGGNLLVSLVVAAIGFFIVSAILMEVWNYTIPRIIASVNPSFVDEENQVTSQWTNISYTTSMVLLILLSMVFSPFAIFREWHAERLLSKMGSSSSKTPSTHIGTGATLESMRAQRISRKSSIGTSR